MNAGKQVLLIISGGIAAYKALELIRRLREDGRHVSVVMTRAARHFVTPLSVSVLAGESVHEDLFDPTKETEISHISLARRADLVVVAPASADLMAKMAVGQADDLASTLLLATDTPVLIAPAMNVRMWHHPATRRNLATLIGDGVLVCGPDEGPMACGETGPGRMADVSSILAMIKARFADGPLAGRHVLVTSGPTHEPIDPVRYIANRSSGAQGAALARALLAQGARVSFITGPASVPPPTGAETTRVQTACDMLAAVEAVADDVDAAILVAAVADWHVPAPFAHKMTKQGADKPPALCWRETPDILATLARRERNRPRLVVGFAAETHDVVARAGAKRQRKGCDWIVANDVRPETGIMGGDENAIVLITQTGAETWPRLSKWQVAQRLADRIASALA